MFVAIAKYFAIYLCFLSEMFLVITLAKISRLLSVAGPRRGDPVQGRRPDAKGRLLDSRGWKGPAQDGNHGGSPLHPF